MWFEVNVRLPCEVPPPPPPHLSEWGRLLYLTLCFFFVDLRMQSTQCIPSHHNCHLRYLWRLSVGVNCDRNSSDGSVVQFSNSLVILLVQKCYRLKVCNKIIFLSEMFRCASTRLVSVAIHWSPWHLTRRFRTMSDARSFDEELIEPMSVRPVARFDTARSQRSSHAPSSHGYTYVRIFTLHMCMYVHPSAHCVVLYTVPC